MFRVSRRLDYGIHLMASLANLPEGKLLPTAALAKELEIPLPFLHQIAHSLMQGGLIQATPGPNGGLKLKQSPESINLYDIASVLEGELKFAPCSDTNQVCPRGDNCITYPIWESLQNEMNQKLRNIPLSSLHPAEKKASESL